MTQCFHVTFAYKQMYSDFVERTIVEAKVGTEK